MKESYEKPTVDIEEFKVIDVITTSGDADNPVWPWD